MDDGEWQSLERSRLNAFFTSPDVIGAIWDGLLALGLGDLSCSADPGACRGRRALPRPAADRTSAARSVRTAIELDTLTARLLKALYPRAAVHSIGFQDAPLRDNSFDVAISNVPFGDFPVVDRAYLKAGQRFLTRSVHNYFFIKTLAKLRPAESSPSSPRATRSMRQQRSRSAPTSTSRRIWSPPCDCRRAPSRTPRW